MGLEVVKVETCIFSLKHVYKTLSLNEQAKIIWIFSHSPKSHVFLITQLYFRKEIYLLVYLVGLNWSVKGIWLLSRESLKKTCLHDNSNVQRLYKQKGPNLKSLWERCPTLSKVYFVSWPLEKWSYFWLELEEQRRIELR